MELLHGAAALAALHDSVESFPQPRCHPETRTQMLEELHDWSLETDRNTTVLWLHGPAGAGKSAIMQTLSRQLQSGERLGGSFFFKRGHATRGNAKSLFATIAYQLALRVPWLKEPISLIVENDPSILARSMEVQLEKLISIPCRRSNGTEGDTVMILIDGLDECEGQDVQEEILRAFRNSAADYSLPVRIIIASRPELHIRELFESEFPRSGYRSFNVEKSFDDVRKYLRDEFSRIRREHRTMANILSPWPPADVLEELVSKSSGHFIYASTVIRFIDDKNYRPTERLALVQEANIRKSSAALDTLDQLYLHILSSSPRKSQLVPVLCATTNFNLNPYKIDQLLGLNDGDTQLVLRGLHSVLQVPSDGKNDDPAISSYHASFRDFLCDPQRSQNFCVRGLNQRMDLARHFLKLLAGGYQEEFNWCLSARSVGFIRAEPRY
ncbi:hypothetical protein K438DRAFT_2140020 [Mycena galopus ATCC 62051]|nr:hypothetical protein K438DRAFT_2140020 [Mycena galopus ATCC 62051]